MDANKTVEARYCFAAGRGSVSAVPRRVPSQLRADRRGRGQAVPGVGCLDGAINRVGRAGGARIARIGSLAKNKRTVLSC